MAEVEGQAAGLPDQFVAIPTAQVSSEPSEALARMQRAKSTLRSPSESTGGMTSSQVSLLLPVGGPPCSERWMRACQELAPGQGGSEDFICSCSG